MNKFFKYCFTTFIGVVFLLVSKAQDTTQEVIPFPGAMQDSIYQSPTAPSSENYQFKEVIHPNTIHTRKVSNSDLNKLKSDEDYWYVNQKPPRERETAPPPKNEKGPKERESQKSSDLFHIPWLNALFWMVLIGGFIALLVWFLSTSNVRLFRKKPKPVEELPEEETPDNIFEMNFEKEIQKAIESKNYRMAVRLMYLQSLRDLSNRNLINYTHEKTNSDYLFQLANTSYYKKFFRLTRSFDYTWYGRFEVTQDSFALIQDDFSSFKQLLH